MHSKIFQSRHTSYDITYEPVTIENYLNYMRSKKTPVQWFVVCANCPVLGCSPDGTVVDPNCEDSFGLLEVKCPETKFHVTPLEACVDPQFFVKGLATCAIL